MISANKAKRPFPNSLTVNLVNLTQTLYVTLTSRNSCLK